MSATIWTGTVSGDYQVAGNWSNGVPTAGMDVYFTNSAVSVTANLDNNAVAIASLNIDMSYTGSFGTSAPTYLYVDATVVNIGQDTFDGTGGGSGRWNIKTKTAGTVVNVYNSTSRATDIGSTPVRLIGAASMVLNVFGGVVGVALKSGETTTVSTLTTSDGTSTVTLGTGVTATTIQAHNGSIFNLSTAATTTYNVYKGCTVTHNGTGAITTMTVGGTLNHGGSGTITTLNVPTGGKIDFVSGNTAMTVTDTNLYNGASYKDDNIRVTNTNTIAVRFCKISDVTISLGTNSTVRR